MWVQVDFDESKTISGFLLDSLTSKDEHARGIELTISERQNMEQAHLEKEQEELLISAFDFNQRRS